MRANPAIDAALALAVKPALAEAMRRQPLPPGVTELLRVLADEQGGRTPLLDAIEHYVQRVLLYPGASPRRVLGVGPDATRAQMREHMRLLMMWLHPDRNGAAWRSSFASRVLEAWREAANAPPPEEEGTGAPPARPPRNGRIAWVRTRVSPSPSMRRPGFKLAIALVIVLLALTTPNATPQVAPPQNHTPSIALADETPREDP
jgi:hypothetical protein